MGGESKRSHLDDADGSEKKRMLVTKFVRALLHNFLTGGDVEQEQITPEYCAILQRKYHRDIVKEYSMLFVDVPGGSGLQNAVMTDYIANMGAYMKLVHKTVASALGYTDEDEFDADNHKHFKLNKRAVERKIMAVIDPKSALGLPQKLSERIQMNIVAQQSFKAYGEQNGFMETAESAAFGTVVTFSAPYYLPRIEKVDGALRYYLGDTPTQPIHLYVCLRSLKRRIPSNRAYACHMCIFGDL
jgi:hypothetical protein